MQRLRLLLINANTSSSVTQVLEEQARTSLSDGVELRAVTAEFGSGLIEFRSEVAIAAHAAVELAARHFEGCNAAIVAVSFDPGLRAVRELLPIPVVGVTEASLMTACMLGARFGLIIPGSRFAQVFRELVQSNGLESRLAGIRGIEITPTEILRNPEGAADDLRDLVRALVTDDGADVVILVGSVMAMVGPLVRATAPVPVLDGLACGVRQAEALARLVSKPPVVGSFAAPPARVVTGVGSALERVLGAQLPR